MWSCKPPDPLGARGPAHTKAQLRWIDHLPGSKQGVQSHAESAEAGGNVNPAGAFKTRQDLSPELRKPGFTPINAAQLCIAECLQRCARAEADCLLWAGVGSSAFP